MKRILSTIVASVLLAAQVFAQVPAANQLTIPQVKQNVITVDKVHPTVLEQLYNIGGLTFFADYSDTENGINADYALGNPMGTFTRTGTAYYTDHTGVMRLAAANTPRITYGIYTESGWTLIDANNKFLIGLMVESAMTNRATYCNTPENAAWTKTNMTANNRDSSSTSPDGTTTAPSLTATGANATFTQSYTDGTAGVYTASIFIKRKTGTGTINLRANTGNSYTDITANVKNYWTRVPVSSTSLTNPTFDLQIVTSGDAVYIWNPQLEKNPYMTSPIPSLTTAAARGVETLSYKVLRNVNTPNLPGAIIGNFSIAVDATTESGLFFSRGSGNDRMYVRKGNANRFNAAFGSNGVGVNGTSIPVINTMYNLGGVYTGTIFRTFVNGTQEGADSSAYTTSGLDQTTFEIGKNSSSAMTNVIVKNICIFNRELNSSTMLSLQGVL